MRNLAEHLRDRGKLELTEASIDGSHAGAKKGDLWLGEPGGGGATKIMAICDRNGLPICIRVKNGERHKTKLVEDALSDCFAPGLPTRLTGDKDYDSDALDAQLDSYGITMISTNRSTTKNKTQDLRQLRRYRHRWKVERFFSWMEKFCRICKRWEAKAESFLGFLRVACAVMLLRRV